MTKTVRLTESFIKKVKVLKISPPLYRHIVDSTTLDRSTIEMPGAAMCKYDEIKHDLNNVNLLNIKIDSNGFTTRDVSSIHSTISVNVYTFEDSTSKVDVPEIVFNDLSLRGIVEEVI